MSHPKVKEQSYANVRGINQKTSVYVTDDGAVLNLENYDFQTPGAWSKRWGYTNAAVNSTLTLGGRPVVDMTTSFNNVYGLQNLVFTDAAPYTYTFAPKSGYVGYTRGIFNYITRGTSPLYNSVSTPLYICAKNFGNFTFWTTGATLYKFLSDTVTQGTTFNTGIYGLPGAGPVPPPGLSLSSYGTGGNFTGTYNYYYGLRDNFGYKTPVLPFPGYFGPVNLFSTFTCVGGETMIAIAGLPVPMTANETNNSGSLYAAKSLVIYRNRVPGYADAEVVSVGEVLAGVTTTYFDSFSGTNLVGYPLPTVTEFPSTEVLLPDVIVSTQARYIESYQNRLFIAAKRGNKIYFSNILSPEAIEPENNFAVVGNQSDITGLKTYNQSLIIGLRTGVWRLSGDSPNNFVLLELTNEYGWLSNKAVVEWRERLWFLDQGRIVEYNGANFEDVSEPVKNIMEAINYDECEEKASAIHIPTRNEVWFSVPVSGTTFNTVLVYDYFVQAWTTFKGIPATALSVLYTDDTTTYGLPTLKSPKVFYGSQGGTLYFFDSSFRRDNGQNITLSFTTKWHQPLPKTAVSQFRRFWIDNGPLAGTTLTYNYAFYANYATATPAATTSFVTSDFQKRYEFGVPAKALSTRVVHESGNVDHFVYGYTVESRFQRLV